MFNFEWFNEMQNSHKYVFLLMEIPLILILIFFIPDLIKILKNENYKK
jgi:hypothetical protein